MATPRKKKSVPSKMMALDQGAIQTAVEAAMRTLPNRWPDVLDILTLAEKYVYLFFDYPTANRGRKKRDTPERDDTESFLRELLAGGRMPVKEIEAEAKSAGITAVR